MEFALIHGEAKYLLTTEQFDEGAIQDEENFVLPNGEKIPFKEISVVTR